jgi:hypothetical protein
MLKELERAVLTCDLPDHGLKRGDVGTIVLVHETPGYEIEFMTLMGDTVAVVSVSTHQVRSITHREIAHSRSLE